MRVMDVGADRLSFTLLRVGLPLALALLVSCRTESPATEAPVATTSAPEEAPQPEEQVDEVVGDPECDLPVMAECMRPTVFECGVKNARVETLQAYEEVNISHWFGHRVVCSDDYTVPSRVVFYSLRTVLSPGGYARCEFRDHDRDGLIDERKIRGVAEHFVRTVIQKRTGPGDDDFRTLHDRCERCDDDFRKLHDRCERSFDSFVIQK